MTLRGNTKRTVFLKGHLALSMTTTTTVDDDDDDDYDYCYYDHLVSVSGGGQ